MLNQKLTGQQAADKTYIEDVFSTYLYTGNGSTQTINNGIQLGDSYSAGVTGGSGLFNGSTNYLSVPTGSALNLSGDFTIEGWIKPSAPGAYTAIFANGFYPSSVQINITYSGNSIAIYVGNGSGWGMALTASSNSAPTGVWTHFAATRNGSTWTIWINGKSSATATYSGSLATPAAVSSIGRWLEGTPSDGVWNTSDSTVKPGSYDFPGELSNLRIVKGTALYTSNFTVPSSALTAVSGTQLLCLQGASPFVDNSPNALTITNYGTTSSSTGPFPYTLVPGKGGLVWLKSRNDAQSHQLYDTARGTSSVLFTNGTNAAVTRTDGVTSFNVNGFSLGANATSNANTTTMASWTFRKAPKFFDVVTWTGNGVGGGRAINHALGQTPGMIIVKRYDSNGDGITSNLNWVTYHRSLGIGDYLYLNSTAAAPAGGLSYFSSTPTASDFSVELNFNRSTETYVAYLFAHDTTTDGLIQCGSYTGNGSATGPTINLGWEPQYVMIKNASAAQDWIVVDAMRGIPVSGGSAYLSPNQPTQEYSNIGTIASPMATGFQVNSASSAVNTSGNTYIYMAIRRGPMRTPTDATKVFQPKTQDGTSPVTTGFVVDNQFWTMRDGSYNFATRDRLRGGTPYLITSTTSAEASGSNAGFDSNTGVKNGYGLSNSISYYFRRAPGFFDVVCYTGTGSAMTVNHNLGVAPELIILKSRSTAENWQVLVSLNSTLTALSLNTSAASGSTNPWNNIAPTSTVFSLAGNSNVNGSGVTFVSYLFASCPGVSKVFSFTGNGSSQTINCGFTNGARLVLIKRTDAAGDWYVWDTARGIVASNDPHLSLNTTAAEVTTDDTIDPNSTGFIVNQVAATNVNVSGASYIYLAIA